MKKPKIVALVISIIILVILINIIIYKKVVSVSERYFPDQEKQKISVLHYYKNCDISGIVKAVHRDTNNHFVKTIFIEQKDDLFKFNVQSDISGLYEYVRQDDSIVKVKGSFSIKVIRNNLDSTFVLRYYTEK